MLITLENFDTLRCRCVPVPRTCRNSGVLTQEISRKAEPQGSSLHAPSPSRGSPQTALRSEGDEHAVLAGGERIDRPTRIRESERKAPHQSFCPAENEKSEFTLAPSLKEKPYTARGTNAPWYSGWDISDVERERFRQTSLASGAAKARAMRGECDVPKLPIPTPRLDPCTLMPKLRSNGLSALSLFSGGGGLDIGFDRAGYKHTASYDILPMVADVLKAARPRWKVFAGDAGDVTQIEWEPYRGQVDVIHGGPPCQPFSHSGSRRGAGDVRDMIPELVRAVRDVSPCAFVCENVSGLATVPSGMRLEFCGAISGNMRLSFQAARSIG